MLVEVVSPVTGAGIGRATKDEVHRPPGILHRGFSAFVFGDRGRLLLQRRSPSKYHFADLWSNSCCSHPLSVADVLVAAKRRTHVELGLSVDYREVGTFRYRAEDPRSGLVEDEFDHVLINTDAVPECVDVAANALEVSETRWIDIGALRRELGDNPRSFSPWLPLALELVETSLRDRAWPGVPRTGPR